MQHLLNDIELDVHELKCLVQAVAGGANPTLRQVASRHIGLLKTRLDTLQQMLETIPPAPETEEPEKDIVEKAPAPELLPQAALSLETVEPLSGTSPILADRICRTGDLRHALSLNDSFRFARELFGGNTELLNKTLGRLNQVGTLDEALALLAEVTAIDEDNPATADFIEFIRKHLKTEQDG